MNFQEGITRCNTYAVWLAVLGLASAAPAVAAPGHMEGAAFIVAKQTRSNEIYPDQRDSGKNDSRDDRRASERKDDRNEPEPYGYGYERRQQQSNENDSRTRGRH